ncbi:O-succinylhomoserine sulfhydrylase [Mangrovicoccus sp. HB161399]|uniref:O-succinylhomoserine sulfhydrylase n=1 Tax=Mangrovicoccus sp. HB161399 TaxID=2720392 RepID=UPI0015574D88|nr:O-succinylhomoserine sulfhydrylase [Mangrovicoccus sp. HB161399]
MADDLKVSGKAGWQPRTKLVHGGTRRSQYNEVSEAMFLTQGFVYETAEQAEARFKTVGPDEFIYARYGNPTVAMFEERAALLEGAEDAFACASGMAAVSGALTSMLQAGDHIVSAKALFGSCLYVVENILSRYGVEVTFVDGTDLEAWKAAVRPDTKAVFLEAISNPTLEVADLRGISKIAHDNGALVLVDNVFATPVFQRSLELGADVVIYSATKHMDGQGRVLGGIVLGTKEFIRGTLEPYMKHTGGSMSPFNAWVLLKGLETMALRCDAQADTAEALAAALDGHPKLEKVIFPGLASHAQHELAKSQMSRPGTMLSIEVKGGQEAAFRVLNALEVFIISNNLGDAKSIVTHPATTTHSRLSDEQKAELGIAPGLIRISCGLEDSGDLVADMLAALDQA